MQIRIEIATSRTVIFYIREVVFLLFQGVFLFFDAMFCKEENAVKGK